jgi:putative ABC transport system permease protein
VAWTFVKRGTVLAGIGAAIGLVAAAALSGALRSLLYGVGSHDVVAFGSATAVVMAIALAASIVPAWRASNTDPLSALRHR